MTLAYWVKNVYDELIINGKETEKQTFQPVLFCFNVQENMLMKCKGMEQWSELLADIFA